MEPFSSMPALRSVLRSRVPSWDKPEVSAEELDPAQVARTAIVELQGALESLYAIREKLALSRSGEAAARQKCGPARFP